MLEISSSKRIEKLETEVFELKALVDSLLAENSYLKDRVKFLENKLSLNSKNSSKPPSR